MCAQNGKVFQTETDNHSVVTDFTGNPFPSHLIHHRAGYHGCNHFSERISPTMCLQNGWELRTMEDKSDWMLCWDPKEISYVVGNSSWCSSNKYWLSMVVKKFQMWYCLVLSFFINWKVFILSENVGDSRGELLCSHMQEYFFGGNLKALVNLLIDGNQLVDQLQKLQ